jgi:hypothetical protein
MFEIGVVERARREDADPAELSPRRAVQQRVAEGAEESGQPLDIGLPVNVGKDTRRCDAVFQREARARRCLRSVTQYPPVAIGSAPDLEGEKMQEMPRPRVSRRPAGAAIPGCWRRSSGCRQMAFLDQPCPVKIGNHRFKQICALAKPSAISLATRLHLITGMWLSGQSRSAVSCGP